MSGGRLVVVGRGGRPSKQYRLEAGLASLGTHPACDIRVLQPAVRPRHATVVVRPAQTILRNVGSGETLVNGSPVSVAALRHGDVITVGDRRLRWEYSAPPVARPPLPSLAARARAGRARRRASGGEGAGPPRPRSLELALELRHRLSAPARQVAVVQPLRRTKHEQSPKGGSAGDQSSSAAWSEERGGQTQAALWIESRKATSPAPRLASTRNRSPPEQRSSSAAPRRTSSAPRRSPAESRRSAAAPRRSVPVARRSLPAGRKRTPLRLTVLRRAQSASKLVKIQPPLQIDRTKRAAIMLMTGHTPKSKVSLERSGDESPSYTVNTQTPEGSAPRGKGRRSGKSSSKHSDETSDTLQLSAVTAGSRSVDRTVSRTGRKTAFDTSVTIFEISDSSTSRDVESSAPASPRKSALKDRSRARSRKGDSIKFDLAPASDDDVTLHFSESSVDESRPLRSSRAGRMLASLGAAVSSVRGGGGDSVTASSPGARRSLRSGLLVSRALQPRAESYSVVDLVSPRSLYDSAASSGAYGTPRLACSTPYARAAREPPPRAPRERSRSRLDDTAPPTDRDDDSPRSSRRATWRSAFGDTTAADGATTPENGRSPSEPGTPVLSIQSLLESSRVSSRASPRTSARVSTGGRRRHTTASAPAARRPPAVARRSLRAAGAGRDVTPRSAAKPTPEAVKGKHSSAKRPHSRRSIIDDLDRSDVVKHLFNSPVKRKLSRSMTEFSRRRSFEEPPPRPRRRTLAVGTVRTPRDSPLDASVAVAPERFVSPIDDAALDGDESPASSAKARRPRARRSIRNDLSDVRGVKALFAASPRNRLSDVRVKAAFARSPENDLRRVSGVKALFRRSPRDDLTDVSGVKRTLRRAAPRDDLTDVRGVRALFARDGSQASHRLSGVEALFDSADRSELLFDELVGRPPRRAVYSKTFTAAARRDTPERRSLRAPADFAPDKVEEWLQAELDKRFRGRGGSAHASPARELRQLATATVAGASPLLARRTRHSDARLPLKKRSLTSSPAGRRTPLKKRAVHSTPVKGRHRALHDTELPRVSPIRATGPPHDLNRSTTLAAENRSTPARVRTPRKQETPRKIDVSGRLAPSNEKKVTPGPPVDVGVDRKSGERRSTLIVGKKSPVIVPKRTTRAVDDRPTSAHGPSPKKTRGRPAADAAQAQAPARRTRLRADRVAVVVAEPSPELKPRPKELDESAPKPRRGRRPAVVKPEISKRTRATVPEKLSKAETTKPTTSRRRRPDAEPSPPPAKRGRRAPPEPPEPTQPPKVTRGRRNDTKHTKVADAPAPSTRTRAAKIVDDKPTKSRGEKNVPEPEKLETKKTRRGGKAEPPQSSPAAPRKRRARAAPSHPFAPPQTNSRKRKSTAPLDVPAKIKKIETKRGKKETTVASPVEDRKRPAKKTGDTNGRVNSTRSKRTKDATDHTRKGDQSVRHLGKTTRSNKTADTKQTEKKETKLTRAQKVEPKNTTTANTKGKKKANVSQSPIQEVAKRSTRKAAKEPTPVKRGRTATQTVAEAPTRAVGRPRRR